MAHVILARRAFSVSGPTLKFRPVSFALPEPQLRDVATPSANFRRAVECSREFRTWYIFFLVWGFFEFGGGAVVLFSLCAYGGCEEAGPLKAVHDVRFVRDCIPCFCWVAMIVIIGDDQKFNLYNVKIYVI